MTFTSTVRDVKIRPSATECGSAEYGIAGVSPAMIAKREQAFEKTKRAERLLRGAGGTPAIRSATRRPKRDGG